MVNERTELFERLYHRNFRRAFSYFVRTGFEREEAAELTQDTLMRVWKYIGNLRDPTNEVDFMRYVMTAARTVRANEIRRRRSIKRDIPESSLDDEVEESVLRDESRSPEKDAAWAEELSSIIGAIRRLPDRHRRAVTLWVYGLSYGEIANAMRTTTDAVKKLISVARRRLKDELFTPASAARVAGAVGDR
jgi:RNA polymerase sigma-70 factor, ECF subfamily